MTAPRGNILLIGMPGSGKSYWAEQIALQTSRLHIDLDVVVEHLGAADIATLFTDRGEAAFRLLEQQALQETLALHTYGLVLACGGGTPCFFDNMQRLKAAGSVVYLRAGIDQLVQHVLEERHKRPLLQHGDLRANLERLLEQRSAIYEQADIVVDIEGLTAEQLNRIIDSNEGRIAPADQ